MASETEYFFILSIVGISVGLAHYVIKSCYTTKCDNIDLGWGCIRLQRNIEEENRDMEFKIEHGIRSSIEDGTINITQPNH